MGRMGKLLRQQKEQTAKYTFTKAQLEEHDRQVIAAWKERAFPLMKKEADRIEQERKRILDEYEKDSMRRINEAWDARAAEFQTENNAENFDALLQYMLAVPARVLIERFGWLPVTGHRFSSRNRIVRFCTAVAEELDMIRRDDLQDVRKYCQEVYDLYGVRFTREVPDD